MITAPRLRLFSPAKLNVFLEVNGRRDDGYHDLETVMLRTSLCDVMQFECTETDDVSLRLAAFSAPAIHEFFPLDQTNLILQAANALRNIAGVTRGATITIHKRIPAEAGLAGGSGNAATTLLALNRLWQLHLTRPQLHEIAASLGSDINFFVAGCRAAVCRGRGEQVQPVPINMALHVVAAQPATGNSTAKVFADLPPVSDVRGSAEVVAALRSGSAHRLASTGFNRLTTSAVRQNPEMFDLIQRMHAVSRRPVLMSGSGSTCFVFARSQREAQRLMGQLSSVETAFLSALRV